MVCGYFARLESAGAAWVPGERFLERIIVRNKTLLYLATVLMVATGLLWFGGSTLLAGSAGAEEIRLLVRADDIGSSHAANVACIKSYTDGIARSVEVMVSAPWFNEAVRMLNENPGYDVGVHLMLTSEWENVKWGPLTEAPSLVDKQGHFCATTSGFAQSKWKIGDVEKELRSQIELAKAKIKSVTHLSSHMGTPTCTPELRELVEKLSKEYDLPIDTPGVKRTPRWGANDMSAAEREQALVKILENLEPGTYMLVEHPGIDCPEMRSIGHEGYWNVAAHRDAVTKAFTSDKVKKTVKKRGIKLISYGDLWDDLRKEK